MRPRGRACRSSTRRPTASIAARPASRAGRDSHRVALGDQRAAQAPGRERRRRPRESAPLADYRRRSHIRVRRRVYLNVDELDPALSAHARGAQRGDLALSARDGRRPGCRGLLPGDLPCGAAGLPAPARGLERPRLAVHDRPPQSARSRAPGAATQPLERARRRRPSRSARTARSGAPSRRCRRGNAPLCCCATCGDLCAPRDRRGDRLLGGGGATLTARRTQTTEGDDYEQPRSDRARPSAHRRPRRRPRPSASPTARPPSTARGPLLRSDREPARRVAAGRGTARPGGPPLRRRRRRRDARRPRAATLAADRRVGARRSSAGGASWTSTSTASDATSRPRSTGRSSRAFAGVSCRPRLRSPTARPAATRQSPPAPAAREAARAAGNALGVKPDRDRDPVPPRASRERRTRRLHRRPRAQGDAARDRGCRSARAARLIGAGAPSERQRRRSSSAA